MFKRMTFTRWLFLIAGIYGLLIIVPMYFMEAQVNEQFPPALTHPEYYYGFIGVTLAWQIAFLIISIDPSRFRLLIIPCVIEKWGFVIALFVLYSQGRVTSSQVGFSGVDFTIGVLFLVSFFLTRDRPAKAEQT